FSSLIFQGSQTLSSTRKIVFGGSSTHSFYAFGNGGNSPATLTIGSGLTIQGGSGAIKGYYTNDTFVNNAAITVASGQTFVFGGANFLNSGTITATGANVNLYGTFTMANL